MNDWGYSHKFYIEKHTLYAGGGGGGGGGGHNIRKCLISENVLRDQHLRVFN